MSAAPVHEPDQPCGACGHPRDEHVAWEKECDNCDCPLFWSHPVTVERAGGKMIYRGEGGEVVAVMFEG